MRSRGISPGRTRSANGAAAGFTLIEMIVVLAVLGLVLTIVLQRGPTRSPSLDLRAASRSLTDALRQARGRAIATDRPVLVTALQAREALARLGSRVTLELHSPPGEPTGNGTLRFDADGGATAALIRLSEGDVALDLGIDWFSGQIRQGAVRPNDGG
ncbi:prepilin-type N-terminal cleavage/methylation domain-containing protein [Lichenicoccus sp.]|uniref:prepilin-type N-terminal cleavage/methylation domain-containing protein n=1 Tax=Lichenicoccus sp. TaxID=2781899 RepID=UPI003D096938